MYGFLSHFAFHQRNIPFNPWAISFGYGLDPLEWVKNLIFSRKRAFTPILVSYRRYVESKHSGLSKLCLLVFLEILERAEKFGFLQTGF